MSELSIQMMEADMRYFTIREETAPIDEYRCSPNIIDEDEMDRRLIEIIQVDHDLEKSKEILLHGKPTPDPWEVAAEELIKSLGFATNPCTAIGESIKAALLKFKPLVEQSDRKEQP